MLDNRSVDPVINPSQIEDCETWCASQMSAKSSAASSRHADVDHISGGLTISAHDLPGAGATRIGMGPAYSRYGFNREALLSIFRALLEARERFERLLPGRMSGDSRPTPVSCHARKTTLRRPLVPCGRLTRRSQLDASLSIPIGAF
jgi:hypothetical protein